MNHVATTVAVLAVKLLLGAAVFAAAMGVGPIAVAHAVEEDSPAGVVWSTATRPVGQTIRRVCLLVGMTRVGCWSTRGR